MNLGLNYFNGSDSGSNLEDGAFKIVATKDKGYAIVGYTYGFGALNTDVYFVKVDSSITAGNNTIISVNETERDDFSLIVFPNPSSSFVNLKSSIEIKIAEVKLYDMTGKEIFINVTQQKRSSNEITLDFGNLADGIYYLKYLNRTEKISIIH